MIHAGIAYPFHDRDWLGGRNYFASLFQAIEAHAADRIRITLILGHNTRTTIPEEFPWLRVLPTPSLDRHHPLWWLSQLERRVRSSDRLLERALRKAGTEVLSHSGNLGARSSIPSVSWLSDFQFMRLPDLWQRRHIRRVRRRYRADCEHCDGVIVSSLCALEDLREFAPHCRARAHVLRFVSNRIDPRGLPSANALRQRYGLPQRFFYLPNQFWENKNHRLAVDALKLLKGDGRDAHVVCTGKTADGRQPLYFPRLRAHIEALGLSDRFRILGVIPREDSLGLMRAALAVLNPSRFEGWSTSVEEAKTLGAPLVLSDIAVHREQVPTNGTFINPDSPESLALALRKHMDHPTFGSGGGAGDFTDRQREFADRYVSILEETIGGGQCVAGDRSSPASQVV
jgi:glycosyltransferase involved in cell wall biosynthesis